MQNEEDAEVLSEMMPLDKNMTLFKIFGYSSFSFKQAWAPSLTDWSAFYTQTLPEHSMRYLTKKWDDGSKQACLVKLKGNNQQLKLISVSHPSLSDHKISGKKKADLIKKHISKKYEISFEDRDKELPLMQVLGYHNIILKCVDSQEPEYIIAHDILNEKNFRYENLIKFRCSNDGLLRTLGWSSFKEKEKWHPVRGQEQFEPYLLLKDPKIMGLLQ